MNMNTYRNLELIQDLMKKQVENGTFAGVAVGVAKNGEIICKSAVGKADLEKNIEMRGDTICRLHSLSKPLTAVGVMILFERGLIDLNHPVSWYLEGFRNQKVATEQGIVPVNREVKIRDLLNMTSGVAYPDGSFEAGKKMGEVFWGAEQLFNAGTPLGTVEFCNKIGEAPLAFQPGERWLYGASADVLGALIEVVSKKKFSEFMHDEIFAPLGMNDTGYWVPDDKKHRFAKLYDYPNGKPVPFSNSFLCIYNYDAPPAFESGGAGAVSTADDYLKFAAMLANKGEFDKTRILGEKTVEFMMQNNLTSQQKKTFNWESCQGYGYGNLGRVLESQAENSANSTLGEYGWDGWSGAYVCVDAKEKLGYVLFVQRCGAGTTELSRRIRQVIYGAL